MKITNLKYALFAVFGFLGISLAVPSGVQAMPGMPAAGYALQANQTHVEPAQYRAHRYRYGYRPYRPYWGPRRIYRPYRPYYGYRPYYRPYYGYRPYYRRW
jgi:hypothetical protein